MDRDNLGVARTQRLRAQQHHQRLCADVSLLDAEIMEVRCVCYVAPVRRGTLRRFVWLVGNGFIMPTYVRTRVR